MLAVGGRDDGLRERLNAELVAFNDAAVGHAERGAVDIRVTGAAGELIGGLTAGTWGGLCAVQLLWVHEDHRRDGWGSRLLRAAEAEAVARGCDRMTVSTFTFQAAGFYERHGFVEVARVPGFPAGHADIHLLKSLTQRP